MTFNVEKAPLLQIAISAAEPSADVLAASLIRALKQQTDATIFGMAGEHMAQSGCKVLWHSNQVNVMGFAEVISKLPRLILLRQRIIKHLQTKTCDVFIGVDAPDFNFHIEKKLKSRGLKTIHFVSPSVWAWRSWRVRSIKKSTDLVLCLLPFEVGFYKQHQINACFVGHPLADTITPRVNYQRNNRLVLLPGSRKSEIKQHLNTMVASVVKLKAQNPQLNVFIPLFDNTFIGWVQQQTSAYDWIKVSAGDGYQQIAQADIAIVASGTAALEVALIATPMVVVYKLSWLSYTIAKYLVKTPFVSLPNIIAGKQIVPELIQQNFTVDNVVKHTQKMLNQDYKIIKLSFEKIYSQLKQNAAQSAAKVILKHLQK